MNKRQQGLMMELFETLEKLSVEYQNDNTFKEQLDSLYMFDENVIDAYNTLVLYKSLFQK